MSLSDAEIERYQRHLVLKEIGGPGQQKLKQAGVLIVGMGGLGQPAAQYLAAAGIGRLGFVDDDCAERSNLQRQVLLADDDVGRAKTEVVAEALARLNPLVTIEAHQMRLSDDNAEALIGGYDLVLDGSDNFATRFLVNDCCFALRKPLISGAVGRFDGQIACFKPWLRRDDGTPHPCYRSLVPASQDVEDNCATTGIVGALTGIIGSVMALEAIKTVTGAGDDLAGHMLIFDGLGSTARRVKINWDPANPNNGHRPAS